MIFENKNQWDLEVVAHGTDRVRMTIGDNRDCMSTVISLQQARDLKLFLVMVISACERQHPITMLPGVVYPNDADNQGRHDTGQSRLT